jgi:hypothetical protein
MFSLEPTNDQAKPAFKDAATCSKWLSQLQLTNLNLAQGTLRAQLDEFNRLPVRGKVRLQTLETLRETVNAVQGDFSKKLLGKKLPLSSDEYTTLVALLSLWQSMLNGYLRCLQSLDAGDASLASDTTLLNHRCLLFSGMQLSEFMRAGYEPDAASWQRFHAVYAHIEEQGLQKEGVDDPLNPSSHPVSCRAVYTKFLLLHRARMLGLSRNQWRCVDRWLDMWGDILTVEPRCSMSEQDAPPLAVDLAGMHGLVAIHRATNAPTMRFLAMVPLSKHIRVKTILLQQGQSPNQLELGTEFNSKDSLDLLNKLHYIWCERRNEALADEPRSASTLQLCFSIDNIYAHIAGKPFKTPNVSGIADKEAQKQIETFGRVLDQTERLNLTQLGFVAEDWLVEEDGLLHARLLRKNGGERIIAGQIIGLHEPKSAVYKIGVATFVCVASSGHLYIAVRYLPGTAKAVIARGTASDNLLSGSTPALMLPDMSNLRIPASLIIPREWFHAGRVLTLELSQDKKQAVTLGISVEKGNDYERVSFALKS